MPNNRRKLQNENKRSNWNIYAKPLTIEDLTFGDRLLLCHQLLCYCFVFEIYLFFTLNYYFSLRFCFFLIFWVSSLAKCSKSHLILFRRAMIDALVHTNNQGTVETMNLPAHLLRRRRTLTMSAGMLMGIVSGIHKVWFTIHRLLGEWSQGATTLHYWADSTKNCRRNRFSQIYGNYMNKLRHNLEFKVWCLWITIKCSDWDAYKYIFLFCKTVWFNRANSLVLILISIPPATLCSFSLLSTFYSSRIGKYWYTFSIYLSLYISLSL